MLLTNEYIDKAFWNKLIVIALPVSLQYTLFALLGVVDIFMVSQLGETATAAVGVGNRITFFNLAVIMGLCGAVTILASQYNGSGNINGIRRTLAQSWVFSILVTVPFIVIYLVFDQEIVSFMTKDSEYVNYARDYLVVNGLSLIATAIVVPIESVLRSVGKAKLATNVSILAIIVNIALNTVLIFGLWGFPQWGVFGAAVGTFISRFVQTAVLVYFFANVMLTSFRLSSIWLKPYLNSIVKGTSKYQCLRSSMMDFGLVV